MKRERTSVERWTLIHVRREEGGGRGCGAVGGGRKKRGHLFSRKPEGGETLKAIEADQRGQLHRDRFQH